MTFVEAVKYMEDGGKVRRTIWKEGYFAIKPNRNGYIYMMYELDDQSYERSYPRFDDDDIAAIDWEAI